MLLLKILWHVVAFFVYPFFRRSYAQQLYTHWVERNRLKFQRTKRFSVIGSGFLYHDAGAFGEVYISPCRRFILKKSQTYSCDSGYSAYLKVIMQNQGNPYVPKVYACLQNGESQVVLMERLHTTTFAQYPTIKRLRQKLQCHDADVADPQLRPILEALCQLLDEGHHNDLREKNVLRRKTPHGDELVITDPLS